MYFRKKDFFQIFGLYWRLTVRRFLLVLSGKLFAEPEKDVFLIREA